MRSRLEGEITELKINIAKMKLIVKKAETFRNEPTNQVKHKLQVPSHFNSFKMQNFNCTIYMNTLTFIYVILSVNIIFFFCVKKLDRKVL